MAEATALLDTLGDYAGSAALAKEYRYQQAQAEAASGNYDAAIALYTELAGYADSDALCRASRYEKAAAAQEAGDYAGAMALFADADSTPTAWRACANAASSRAYPSITSRQMP